VAMVIRVPRSSTTLPFRMKGLFCSNSLGIRTSTQYIAQASKIAPRDMTSGANQKLTFRRSQVKRAVTLLFARVLMRHLCLASHLTQSIHLDPGPPIVHLIPTTRYTSP